MLQLKCDPLPSKLSALLSTTQARSFIRPANSPSKRFAPLLRSCQWLLLATLIQVGASKAESIPVRYPEGTTHGFLALRTTEGKLLASGDLTEILHGNEVKARLVFRFKDGSVDDDTTVFSQHGVFRLITDHHVQKGPSFPHPTDILIKAATGQVTVHYQDNHHEKVHTEHMDLPADLANGFIIPLLKNISPEAKEVKVSYLGAASKPRIVHLSITPSGNDRFSVAGGSYNATRFTVKVELGGINGMIAPLIGKKPADGTVWMLDEGAPMFVRAKEPLYLGGPLWTIEIAAPQWSHASHPED